MATFHTPNTSHVATDVFGATEVNNLGDSLNYLLTPVGSSGRRDNGSNYTIAANTFAAVDSTNLAKTITLTGTRVMVMMNGVVSSSSPSRTDFDVNVNGTRWGVAGTEGIATAFQNTVGAAAKANFAVIIDGLTPGSNTFQLLWKAQAGTSTLYSGAGSAGTDWIPTFDVVEC